MRFSLGLVLALSFLARTAGAQEIAVANEASLPRVDAAGNQLAKRSTNLTPEAVSYQDCVDDQRIRLAMTLTGYETNASIEVWASNTGISCSEAVNRGGGAQQCWRVTESGSIGIAVTTLVDVPVRRILSGVSPFTPIAPDATENACGKVDLANIALQILYFTPGNLSIAAANKTIGVTVDTVGPGAPTGLTALPGNERVAISFANISGGTADGSVSGGLTELTGVNAYCDLARTTADPDAGTTNSCTTELLVPGAVPPPAQQCGSFAGNAGTTVSAETLGGQPLQNGTTYAVAVAATDRYGNVGPLSSVVCGLPEQTTDFWDNYRDEGGQAGCATSDGAPTSAFAAVLALGGLAMVRRRRRA